MHLLVSFCNVRAPGVPALGLLNAATMEFHVLQLPPEAARCSGITGLALCDRYVYMAAQPAESWRIGTAISSTVLLIFQRRDLSLAGRHEFRSGTDIHSLLAREGRIYAVSTGTDEIIELRLRNAEVVSESCIWRPERDAPREDIHHLNALAVWRDELVVAAFGKKTSDRWHSARDGFIMNIATGEMLAGGLDQPHSVVDLGAALACCESRKRSVRAIGDERVQYLPGYTRGFSLLGETLFVATSIGRQRSRSTGLTNNPADDGVQGGQCTISRLATATFEIEQTIDLGTQAQEIYDLLPVEDAANWAIVDEISWRNSSIHGLAGLLDQRTNWAKQSTAGMAQRDATISALRQELNVQAAREKDVRSRNESLAREITELRQVTERQSATLEALKSTVEDLRRAVAAAKAQQTSDRMSKREYAWQLSHIRQIAAETLPADARVAVVSKGDDELLKAVGRQAWHFPQTVEGDYSGTHPASSLAAIAHLEALRVKGADFLLFPGASLWWLDHYTALKSHLDRRYRKLASDDACLIFDLRESVAPGSTAAQPTIDEIIDRCRDPSGGDPAILDWNTGLKLAQTLTRHAVFSPPTAEPTLPYLDHSVDIVIVPNDQASIAEARRVASAAVLTVSPSDDSADNAPSFAVEWQVAGVARPTTAVSIICLADDSGERAERWQAALQSSLPDGFAGEILWAEPIDGNGDGNQRREQDSYAVACNRAAARATGDLLIFLNRRTIPLEGWLAPLLNVLHSQPRAGVVGSKILYADARLDQAGGVAFSDASLAGFGNGDYQIDDPLYGYVRETDYCGDAVLATTRSLFEDLSGFDSAYASPAYAHADFCFRARERGFGTYYQPDSLLVSVLETAGRPGSPDPAADLAGDHEQFRARWKDILEKQPLARPWRDRDIWQTLAVRCELAGEVCR
jgi:hypothetical protein